MQTFKFKIEGTVRVSDLVTEQNIYFEVTPLIKVNGKEIKLHDTSYDMKAVVVPEKA